VRILFCGNTFPDAPQYLRQYLDPTANDEILVCEGKDLIRSIEGVDILIPKMQRIGADVIQQGTFRLIQQWGAGLEGIDLEAASSKGVFVSNVPADGGNAESVAEHAMLLTLALLRSLPESQQNVRTGILGSPLGRMLAGRTVCIYGLGAIALPLARRLRAFDANLIGISREVTAEKTARFHLSRCYSVEEQHLAFAETDVLILCMRYTENMRGMIGALELTALKPGSYLINVARGGVIDEQALYTQLSIGHLAGAGLDVFWQEPLPVNDPILSLPNVIATPHVGGVTETSFKAIAGAVAANIERLRRGQLPLHCIT